MRGSDAESLRLRRYFATTVSQLREHARAESSHYGDILQGLVMRLETAQFVWVLEYCTPAQWSAGTVAARAIVDATASPHDPDPMWLIHDGQVAHVFDRTFGETDFESVDLGRKGLGPLPRMEINLRPVLDSPRPADHAEATTQPGGET